MVHRIQNRNPGYSDFASTNGTASFSFSGANSNPLSHGANALKLENEVITENFNESVDQINNGFHEEFAKNLEAESVVENSSEDKEISFSQEALNNLNTEEESSTDLKEFGVDTNEPDLFSSENESSSHENLLESSNDEKEEDDLEIPAFLRRQKN